MLIPSLTQLVPRGREEEGQEANSGNQLTNQVLLPERHRRTLGTGTTAWLSNPVLLSLYHLCFFGKGQAGRGFHRTAVWRDGEARLPASNNGKPIVCKALGTELGSPRSMAQELPTQGWHDKARPVHHLATISRAPLPSAWCYLSRASWLQVTFL